MSYDLHRPPELPSEHPKKEQGVQKTEHNFKLGKK
jgi:hypothetical protein